MGNPASKIDGEIDNKEFSEGSVPSTPILTPKVIKTDNELDPRSPSLNIIRTPLEFSLQSKLTLNPNHIENDNKTPTVCVIDPRSPTTEFTRTPIIIGVSTKSLPDKLHNKHLDKACKQEFVQTPIKIMSNINKRSKIIPPKLLESSPVSVDLSQNKRKSFVGLLETNVDYTETDLDMVTQNKSLEESIQECSLEDKTNLEVSTEDVDNKMLEVIEDKTNELSLNEQVEDIQNTVDAQVQTDNINIIILSDVNLESVKDRVEAKTVSNFDKKLTNLIYEDENDTVTVKIPKFKEGNRTPLGNCNVQSRKPIQKLKVSDKPTKHLGSSKIPVFKDKHENKLITQCENTPPRSMLENTITNKKTHWDPNTTLII